MKTDFAPKRNGFHFPNSFTNPVVQIPGFGQINTYGLCGGMSFASLDYYHAGRPVPTHIAGDFPGGAAVPPVGDILYQYIYDRQLASFNPLVNPSIIKFVTQSQGLLGRTCYEVTIQDEWPQITGALDSGQPVALGLIAESNNPTESHQVVAIGYESSPKQIHIYDCNYPDADITLLLDDAGQVVRESTGDRWKGLFLEQYEPQDPIYLDLGLSVGINTNPSATATAGDPVEVGFTIKNYGFYPAHMQALDASVTGPLGEDLDGLFTSIGTPPALASGATQTYLVTNNNFGQDAGAYELVAWFKTSQAEWFPVPPGDPGTMTSTTLDAV